MASVVSNAFRDGQQGKQTGSLVIPVSFHTPDPLEAILTDDTDLSSPASPISASFGSKADLIQGTPVSSETSLTGVVVKTPGIFDATDMTGTNAFIAVTGDEADSLSIYKEQTTARNAVHIVSWFSISGSLPVTPNGGDITVTWNSAGILQI